jgi:pyrimidine-nucleoside phosphorylase
MRAVDIIARKRDGLALTRDEISFIVRGYTSGDVPDYQMAALLMAIYLRGMGPEETGALTEEMLYSGRVVEFSDLGGMPVDKHSTGGVGDKTSLVIAPAVAAAGVVVPMISGRSLGHSGGTLDKLESIPGFRTNLTLDEFQSTLRRVGAALIGQTEEIAPADRKLYALRDVTATVECLPLMAASIMSKKMAEGIEGLVLDVKTGSGAFLKTEDQSHALARVMIDIARGLGKECVALITDMNQPLGRAVGNSLEVIEAFETLAGRGPDDLRLVCRELSAHMIALGRAADSVEAGREVYERMIESGAALEKMREIIRAQGGDIRVLEDHSRLPGARFNRPVFASQSGYVTVIDAKAIGHASMLIGAGRLKLDTRIDPGAGIRVDAKIGDKVEAGSTIATLYFNDAASADEAAAIVERAYRIGQEQVESPELIKSVIG